MQEESRVDVEAPAQNAGAEGTAEDLRDGLELYEHPQLERRYI